MSSYHLHARMFVGSLVAPTRNELQTDESDDLDEVVRLAEHMVDEGFAVWVYEHVHGVGPNGRHAPYRLVAEWAPDGCRRR